MMNAPHSHRVVFKSLLLVSGISLASYWLASSIYDMILRSKYTKRRTKKQSENIRAKKRFCEYLKENPLSEKKIKQIVEKPFCELIKCLKHGEFTPQKVLLAYQHKAFKVDQQCNCVVEFLYPNFDEINLNGPLAGAPVSIKENLNIKGSESHAGMVKFLNGPSSEDSYIIQVIKSFGGVPFARTNVPQSMFSVLSSNPIDGITLNPLALDRSPGGSSSGEAALIAGGGSGLGFGTDLGGSVRFPAAMCGIVGFKPTPKRVSKLGISSHGRYITLESSVGFPCARCTNVYFGGSVYLEF
ncbi:unnamed protein product [Heterobilharzia americana]|nr:unnamed protein product [Heterobilharzia americana]